MNKLLKGLLGAAVTVAMFGTVNAYAQSSTSSTSGDTSATAQDQAAGATGHSSTKKHSKKKSHHKKNSSHGSSSSGQTSSGSSMSGSQDMQGTSGSSGSMGTGSSSGTSGTSGSNPGGPGGGSGGSGCDPNDKTGPLSPGAQSFVNPTDPMPYTVYFENVATASAYARRVTVSDVLDTNLDIRSFRLGQIVFNNRTITIPANRSYFQTRVAMTDQGTIVEEPQTDAAPATKTPASAPRAPQSTTPAAKAPAVTPAHKPKAATPAQASAGGSKPPAAKQAAAAAPAKAPVAPAAGKAVVAPESRDARAEDVGPSTSRPPVRAVRAQGLEPLDVQTAGMRRANNMYLMVIAALSVGGAALVAGLIMFLNSN